VPLAAEADLAAATGAAAGGELGGVALLGTPGPGLPDALAALRASAPHDLLVASDEEGGTAQRLDGLLGPMPSASTVAATVDPDAAREQARAYGEGMAALGVNVAFAPVLDVGGGPGIGTRSYSVDPQVVADYGIAVASGFADAGVLPVLKHFPGHGRASADSHLTLPTAPPVDELRAVDLVPYERAFVELSGVSIAVMVAHLDAPGLTDGTATSLSPAAIDGLLRTELGFDGLVFTDSLTMGAVASLGAVETIRLALIAGADVAIVSRVADVPSLIDGLVAAVDAGRLDTAVIDDSVARVFAAKGLDPCAVPPMVTTGG
jgi:beta-N-acetylhexosaminidase